MPDWQQEVRKRLADARLEPTREQDIVEELSQHLDDHYSALLAGGAHEDEAYLATLVELSYTELLSQQLRRVEQPARQEPVLGAGRGNVMLGDIRHDLRYGLRLLIKHPGLTFVSVMSLALGIGANTAIFSLVNATLIRRLPVAEPESLVYVFNGNPGGVFSYPDYAELRDLNQVFNGLIAWGGIAASLNSEDQTDLVTGAIVTGNYFQVLGVHPALGRVITPEDDRTPGAHPVVVISHGLWQRRFGGRADIIGRELLLNGHGFTIIGVAPVEFGGAQLGVTRDLYVPMMMQAVMRPPRAGYSGEMNPDLLRVRGNRWLFSLGRLKPGVTGDQAQAALTIIAEELERTSPDRDRTRRLVLTAVNEGNPTQRGQMVSAATLLMSVVGVVLLIACANVANLLLARASARRKEIAVRLAIGASRWRLVRQLLTESVMLAALGGGAGLLLGWWTVERLKSTPPPPGVLPITPDFTIDLRVLAFTLGLSLLTGICFGLAPALRASRPDLVPALKDDSFASDFPVRRFNLRNSLVVAQVALSLVLLIIAGLFLRSLVRAEAIDPGFQPEKLLTTQLNINLLRYTRDQGRQFYQRVVERVEAVPGAESACLARVAPLTGFGSIRGLMIEGQTGPEVQFRSEGSGMASDSLTSVSSNVISLRYFQTMGISFVNGRDFDGRDTEDRPRVVIVNESFVRRHFAGQEALGRRLSVNGAQGPWQEIIGVVRDSKYSSLTEGPTPVVYLPLQQNHETGMTLHVRGATELSGLAAAVRSEVQALDRNVPVTNIRPMTESLSNSLYAARMGAVLISVFGSLALLLAAVGLYGVMSYSVSRRTREVGLRMALGADAGDVLRLVLREGMLLVGIGLALGLAVAMSVTRLLTSFLYGISTMDAMTFAGIPVILMLVALVACFLPARRATRVDPIAALRYE